MREKDRDVRAQRADGCETHDGNQRQDRRVLDRRRALLVTQKAPDLTEDGGSFSMESPETRWIFKERFATIENR